jgi:hypothetical protein
MLHITNGDSAADQLRSAGLSGRILPWRDVLHEGPVPLGLSMVSLREVRARFIAGKGWGKLDHVLHEFAERDAVLELFPTFGETVLWFEDDLYDQLQMLQVLHYLDAHVSEDHPLSLISVHGALGTVPLDHILELLNHRSPLSKAQVSLGSGAWIAFRSPDPTGLEELAKAGPSALPHLAAALLRHLQQFPSTDNGLSLSEQNALEVIALGRSRLREAFVASHHEREHPVFLGDMVFASYLESLSQAETPLVTFDDGSRITGLNFAEGASDYWERSARLTTAGEDVLAGKQDRIRLNGIDRWLGGVYLAGRGPLWRWNSATQSLHYL